MNYAYDILFEVSFSHNYFRDQKTESFGVSPSESATDQMKKEGLLFKRQPDGFFVLYDRNHAGRLRSKEEVLSSNRVLTFYIKNNDPLLFNYTGGFAGYEPDKYCLLFTNTKDRQDGRLHANEHAGKEDQFIAGSQTGGAIRHHPFGIIRISLGDIQSEKYHVSFEAKSTYWCYVLASSYSKELQQPAVLDKADQIVFTGPSPVTLPDRKEAIMFTSQSRLTMSHNPELYLRLVENYSAGGGRYKVVVPQLPYPDVAHLSAIGTPAQGKSHSDYSYIII